MFRGMALRRKQRKTPAALAGLSNGGRMTHPRLDELVSRAAAGGPRPVAVVYPCNANALEAAVLAAGKGLIRPILVGPAAAIRALAEKQGFDLAGCALHDTGPDPVAAAHKAVELCHSGEAKIIMKGSLHTDELLGVVVRKESGLRTSRRMSHAFVFDAPSYPKLLMMADCVVNIAPGLMEKRDIVQNAVDLAHGLGVARPAVAVLSAVETINPAIPGTIEAAALAKMAERGQITGADVDGPLAFDNAVSAEAARMKGFARGFATDPDILIAPNLEAGNMLYKQLIYLAKAECAGIILGVKVPIVLTSRSDSIATRVASCALAALTAAD
jgi:phosphate acetyltransferase